MENLKNYGVTELKTSESKLIVGGNPIKILSSWWKALRFYQDNVDGNIISRGGGYMGCKL